MQRLVLLIAGGFMVLGCAPQDSGVNPREATESRSIELTVMAEVPPMVAFRLWSTEAGATCFFAPAAHIGTAVGEPYELVFDPANDPEGAHHGTKGATIRAVEAGRSIAFGWTFPPFGEEFNTPPFPTWVEIEVEPFPGDGSRSLVHFAHRGFPVDPAWDQVFDLFRDSNWPLVLNRFLVYSRDGVSPAWDDPEGDRINRVLSKEIEVRAPVTELWRAWTTTEGLESFFAERATVELRSGGPFEILFDLEAPAGQRGSEGCQVIGFEAEKWLTFSWNSPPSLPEVRPLHTNVIVRFEPVENGAATRVKLLALGWGSGESWMASHQYFDRAWDSVLGGLKRALEPLPDEDDADDG